MRSTKRELRRNGQPLKNISTVAWKRVEKSAVKRALDSAGIFAKSKRQEIERELDGKTIEGPVYLALSKKLGPKMRRFIFSYMDQLGYYEGIIPRTRE